MKSFELLVTRLDSCLGFVHNVISKLIFFSCPSVLIGSWIYWQIFKLGIQGTGIKPRIYLDVIALLTWFKWASNQKTKKLDCESILALTQWKFWKYLKKGCWKRLARLFFGNFLLLSVVTKFPSNIDLLNKFIPNIHPPLDSLPLFLLRKPRFYCTQLLPQKIHQKMRF